ncbi:unnamed protein product [Dicrocoelium dendriticum]|nr:unnamed protein product [Dicrocoelium dendriticum]
MVEAGVQSLNILHFNDVYNVEGQNVEPVAGAARFRTALMAHGAGEDSCIVLFSGDALSPSIISNITQGKHMPTILNDLFIDCAVVGNHDLDFGLDILCECIESSQFPWLDTNVMDRDTNQPLLDTKAYHIIERGGVRIGIIGLLEEEWIATLSCVDTTGLIVLDMCKVGQEWAKRLKKSGPYECDIVVALTHMRWPNDRKLAEKVPEIDLILGGHDHDYHVEWLDKPSQECHTRAIIKSGSDFRTFSKISLNIDTTQKCIAVVTLEEVTVDSRWKPDGQVTNYITSLTKNMEKKLDASLGRLEVPLDCRFSSVRTKETNLGNFLCDITLTAVDADMTIINSGVFRADRIIPAGDFLLRDLVSILPILDTLVLLEATGKQVLEVLENGVSQYPKPEGRFPSVSGIRFCFDPTQPSGSRVPLSKVIVQGQPLQLGRKYRLCVKAYMAHGKDGYSVLKECPVIVDEENGTCLSTLVQNYFRAILVCEEPLACHLYTTLVGIFILNVVI